MRWAYGPSQFFHGKEIMSILGKSGIEVSELCFGSLTMSSFQANLSLEEGAELLQYGYEKGINFIDTAEIYENYHFIHQALKSIPRDKLVIATKAYSYDQKTADESLNKALRELDTDYIDIFLLHEQESEHTLRGHKEALETLFKRKEEGYIRSVGISSHFIQCIQASQFYKEIEIIHPIINFKGIGIQDGSKEEMLKAIQERHEQGIGIYSMKALGGGHLIKDHRKAIEWIRNIDYIDATAVGMQTKEEIDYNTSMFFSGREDKEAKKLLDNKKRKLIVADYCIGCGSCVDRCKQEGIELKNGKAVPNENCILCGYCATVCPEFCIKVI